MTTLDLSVLPVALTPPQPNWEASPEMVGKHFETLLLESLLGQAGLFKGLAQGSGAEWAVMEQLWTQKIAAELASRLDLGLGKLIANQMPPSSAGEGNHG